MEIYVKDYKPRLKAPSTADKYYIKANAKYGGLNLAMLINANNGSCLPNCCGLVHGRWLECTNEETTVPDKLCTGNASSYANYNDGYERTGSPRVGDVICFTNHVAFVEEVHDDGSITVSSSSYGGTRFTTKKLKKPYNWSSSNKFKCFIKNPRIMDNPDEPVYKYDIGDKVKILKKGNSRPDGKGKSAGGVGWTRYILAIKKGAEYPYKVGNKLGITTGWYKEEALKQL